MRALKWVVCLSFILATCALARDSQIEHQRGVELRGGYGLYLKMGDPNNFAQDFTGTSGYSQKEYTESQGTFLGGISFLYKTQPYFSWHVGLNVLGTDSATALAQNAAGQQQQARIFMNTVELSLTANYYWNLTPRFNLEFGAGPAFYLSSLDREVSSEAQSVYGESFYGAHGRSFGFTGNLGAELFLNDALSLKLGGGFRWAPVTRFKYFRELVGPEGSYNQGQIAYWANSFDTFEADFSGAFVDLGLRIYFDPAAPWNQYGD